MSQQPKTNTEVQHLSLFDYSEQSKKALSYRQVHDKNLFGHLSQTMLSASMNNSSLKLSKNEICTTHV